MNPILVSLSIAVALVTSNLKAERVSVRNSVQQLVYQTQQLDSEVRYAPINYEIKNSVARFSDDVYRLKSCTDFTGHSHGYGIPLRCQNELYTARNTFQYAEQYLRNTYNAFPGIYREYVDTRQALYTLQVINPGPGPGPGPIYSNYRCQASDAGWEEHGGGHIGYGRVVAQAQRQAILECRRFHGSCRILRCDPGY